MQTLRINPKISVVELTICCVLLEMRSFHKLNTMRENFILLSIISEAAVCFFVCLFVINLHCPTICDAKPSNTTQDCYLPDITSKLQLCAIVLVCADVCAWGATKTSF